MKILSLIARRKIFFQPPKIWDKIDREPIVDFIHKSDESDQ